MAAVESPEATPLIVKTLRHYEEDDNNERNQHNGGKYRILQKLITSSPASGQDSQLETAEIESRLEEFVERTTGSILWQRVIVQSGPTSPHKITHASYMLPKDSLWSTTSSNKNVNRLCWTTFPDRPKHPLLCVLANPTLVCIWDVYPNNQQQQQHSNAETNSSEGGEGHTIPLPFEACAIYGVENGQHGLLLQRSESTEDILLYNNNHNQHSLHEDEDDGFVLKAPPRPVRLRDSTSTPLAVPTATTPTMAGGSPQLPHTNTIPSLFSLHHPQGDILPVSTKTDAMMADVFEKILFTGLMKWVDDANRPKEQPICVTYHTQLRRHAVWELCPTPPPVPQAPLWQVSKQWRSKNGWDSHLGVLGQDLEDFELVDKQKQQQQFSANRNDALADALGVKRSTPRNSAANPGTETKPNRSSMGRAKQNVSLLSPLNHDEASVVHNSTSQAHSHDSHHTPFTRMGPFGSLHPKTSMKCIYVDSNHALAPAQEIFVASNTSGSGLLSLCLVCPTTSASRALNPQQLTVFSLVPVVDSTESNTDTTIPQKLTVRPEGSVPCVAAQPMQSSPIPKNYESNANLATDILLLRKTSEEESILSLYRNTQHVVDCTIAEVETTNRIVITNLTNPCGNLIDISYGDSNQNSTLRGKLSLVLHSDALGETLLRTFEAACENIRGLDVLALKARADCVRLEDECRQQQGLGAEIAKIVVLSLFRLDLLGLDVNEMEQTTRESTKSKSHWELLLECSKDEPFATEYRDLFGEMPATIAKESESRLGLEDLANLGSLAVEHLASSESTMATTVFDAFHLFYEEMKLYSSKLDGGLTYIGSILCDICAMSSCELSSKFLSYYFLDLEHYEPTPTTNPVSGDEIPLSTFVKPPSILSWIEQAVRGNPLSQLFSDFDRSEINTTCARIRSFLRIFPVLCNREGDESTLRTRDLKVVKMLLEEGFTDPEALRDGLPAGVALPLLDLFHRCRTSPIGPVDDVDPAVWSLIGRDDTHKKISEQANPSVTSTIRNSSNESDDSDKDGIAQLELASSMLFPEDNRIKEAGRLLRSSKPSFLRVPRAIEVSDHDYERQKQEKLLMLSRRVLALPLGRGMLTIGNLKPVPAEPLPLPEICLSGRIHPTNTTMALDISECPVDMKVWPEFHNGVAAGLRLPLHLEGGESITKITRTWIVYNRPSAANNQNDAQNNINNANNNANNNNNESNASQGQNHAHGGLLMALGMRGHLTALEMTDIFDYLTHGSVTTTVGCLLGMAANMRGTCDISVSKMLCLHIPSLIPQHFSTIDVASTVQAAAVAGAGLLYEGSSHRMMTEFLLNEIGKRPSNDGNVLDREAYTLACGIALGMVNLCKGTEGKIDTGAGLSDLRIEERLYRYIVGGIDDAEMRRRYEESDRLSLPPIPSANNSEKCSCIYEGDSINIDVTAPGATLALGLMYMKSGNKTIASAIALPDTHFLLEYVRPDFLMFRVISRALILWDDVKPTEEWVEAQIPKAAHKAYKEMRELAESIQQGNATKSDDVDYDRQAVRYIYTHVIAAACFSIGLRFAGTGNTEAASIIFERVMELMELRDAANPISAALRPPTPVLEMCLGCAAISLSLVLAGTGNLDALRLLKILRWPCSDDVSYGSHQAFGTAIGLLFLGGGSCTLGREPKDVAALIMAFYPRFPSSTSDNQYHLQALRNLYALAVKKREIKAIDVDTGECVFAPVEVHFADKSADPLHLTAPCLLVNTDEVPNELRVVSKQHYPLTIKLDDHFGNKIFYVKRRSAHMYGDRPHFHTSFTHTDDKNGRGSLDSISSFTDDQRVIAFAKHFCDIGGPKTRKYNSGESMSEFCTRILHECFMRDSQQAIPLYLTLRNSINMVNAGCSARVAFAWDFRLIRSYYEEGGLGAAGSKSDGLLNCELITYLIKLLEYTLLQGNFGDNLLCSFNSSAQEELDMDEMDLS